jgi:cyclophilin family peptidyl-prolyl cis-trans isomerase/HEAT repeat protein
MWNQRAALTCVTLVVGLSVPAAQESVLPLNAAIIAAEDARGTGPDGLEPILAALGHPRAEPQRLAVRALGRLERPDLLPEIVPLLSAESPLVRAEAANALAQSVQGPSPSSDRLAADVRTVVNALVARLGVESDPTVMGAIAESLGRLPYGSVEQVREAERILMDVMAIKESSAAGTLSRWAVYGAARGLESLFRRHAKLAAPEPATLARLRDLVLKRSPTDSTTPARTGFEEVPARIRRVAMIALVAAQGVNIDVLRAAFADPDPQVRRLAAVSLVNERAVEGAEILLRGTAADPDPMVRYDVRRAQGARQATLGCQPALEATGDPSPHVVLLVIDLLGNGCPEREAADRLQALAANLPDAPDGEAPAGPASWHAPAHAVVALSRVAPDQARGLLARFASHPVWQVRMYAAQSAATLADTGLLQRLASDESANVAEAAIAGLRRTAGHAADGVYRAALGRGDYQVVMTAAQALEGTSDRRQATDALSASLARITAERRETSRDTRRALLDRLAEVAGPEDAPALEPYVKDFDRQIAERAGGILGRLTGRTFSPAPVPLPAPHPPGAAELDALASSRARVVMQFGGAFDLTLHPEDAPLTCARFVRLARAGYYNGLTFHRVVPNFVIQGGSPGANEFAGDGPYLRDELGLRPHLRGAVGISTRGRDTGDAQIFVDLVDLPRLDHNYTVFATVSRGMDVVDGIVEGDVIERVEILSGSAY